MACAIVLPLRVGQSIQQGDIPPCAQSPGDATQYPDNTVPPKYPKDALRSGIEAKVELRVVITPDGKLEVLALLSGDSEFSQNAISRDSKVALSSRTEAGAAG